MTTVAAMTSISSSSTQQIHFHGKNIMEYDADDDQESDDDDRDTAEVIALIISGAVLAIVLCLICTYCICSRMNGSSSD